MKQSTSILFMGTPHFAAKALSGLLAAGFDVVSVVTRPDAGKGRGGKLTSSEVKLEAERHNLPVYQPKNKAELIQIVEIVAPELVVVAAYGMIIPQEALDIPKYGALNIHGSILPNYRGASPIAESLLNGDEKTGITIIKMSAGMDEGDVISSFELLIPNDSTTETLTNEMADLGARAIVKTIPGYLEGSQKPVPQNSKLATYCKKITKEDGHIDWNLPAVQIERIIRAYNTWPTAYTFLDGKRVKVLKAKEIPGLRPGMTEIGVLNFENGHVYVNTGKNTLELLQIQPEGKKPVAAKDFINGNKNLDKSKFN